MNLFKIFLPRNCKKFKIHPISQEKTARKYCKAGGEWGIFLFIQFILFAIVYAYSTSKKKHRMEWNIYVCVPQWKSTTRLFTSIQLKEEVKL